MAKALAETGLDGIAATPPYYYLYDQGEIADHFRAISDAVSQPLWVYNIPITVKLTVEPATIANLAAEGHRGRREGLIGAGRGFRRARVALPKERCRDVSLPRVRLPRDHDEMPGSAWHHPRWRERRSRRSLAGVGSR